MEQFRKATSGAAKRERGAISEYSCRMEAQVRRFRVPLSRIAYVRMIVEAYEGLAVMVSARGSTLVEWQVAPGREEEADSLAESLGLRPG